MNKGGEIHPPSSVKSELKQRTNVFFSFFKSVPRKSVPRKSVSHFNFFLKTSTMAPPASAQAPANIRVLVRVRPLNRKELIERGSAGRTNVLNLDTSSKGEIDFNGEIKENGATISVNNTSDLNRRMTSGDYRAGYTSDGDMNNANGGSSKQYMFDAVHGERSTQSEVYESVKGIVDAVVDGYNGTIVAYGQTGSGKTHTVFGSSER